MILQIIFNPRMKAAARKRLFAFLGILIFAHVAMAQNSVYPNTQSVDVPGNPTKSLDLGTSQLGIWAGYSSSNPTLIGRSTNRPFFEFFEFNVHYARVLRTGNTWSMKYIAEIMPVAIIKQPQQGYTVNGNPVDLPGSRRSIHGAGISPIGLQMNLRRGCVLQPYVNGTAGGPLLHRECTGVKFLEF